MRILIATQDDALVRLAGPALQQAGYEVTTTAVSSELPAVVEADPPAVLILDAAGDAAGERDALAQCRPLREQPSTSQVSLLVVAPDEERSTVVTALAAGADDCVTRPLYVDELVARIRALRHRPGQPSRNGRLLAGPIDMDLDRWTVTVNGAEIELTKLEFRLLQILLQARGRVLSRDTLLADVWSHAPEHGLDTRTVDVHVGRLRRKLGAAGRHILTVRNVGFRFEVVPDWITTR